MENVWVYDFSATAQLTVKLQVFKTVLDQLLDLLIT